jgi:CubicO group peptidase (beta-lactamase class C family)
MRADTPHILMSVSKSVLGILAGILVERGDLVLDAHITGLVPEVAKTAYAGATLRNMLDMRVGVHFEEDYRATSGPIIDYRKAQNWDPLERGETPSDLRRFFRSLVESDGTHNSQFHYVSPNTDLLGWVIERATGNSYADLVRDLLWRPMGASRSAYITVDRLGAPRCAGGFCATTRDLARLGQLILRDGQRDGDQIIPQSWIKDIYERGDAAAWGAGDFAEYLPDLPIHYRNKWYVLKGQAPMMFGVGIFGQNLFVDPANEIVVAKFSSQGAAMDHQRIALTMRAVAALRKFISGRGGRDTR